MIHQLNSTIEFEEMEKYNQEFNKILNARPVLKIRNCLTCKNLPHLKTQWVASCNCYGETNACCYIFNEIKCKECNGLGYVDVLDEI